MSLLDKMKQKQKSVESVVEKSAAVNVTVSKPVAKKQEEKEKKIINNLMFYEDYKMFYKLAYTLRKSKTDTINFLIQNFIDTYNNDRKFVDKIYSEIIAEDRINQVKSSMYVDTELYNELLEIESFADYPRVHTLSLVVNVFVNQSKWLTILDDPKFKEVDPEKFIKFYYK